MLVTAKRLGWDQLDGTVLKHDDYDPPAWSDDDIDAVIQGKLVVQTFPADEMYRERKVYTVGGQLVDPRTIKVKRVDSK